MSRENSKIELNVE